MTKALLFPRAAYHIYEVSLADQDLRYIGQSTVGGRALAHLSSTRFEGQEPVQIRYLPVEGSTTDLNVMECALIDVLLDDYVIANEAKAKQSGKELQSRGLKHLRPREHTGDYTPPEKSVFLLWSVSDVSEETELVDVHLVEKDAIAARKKAEAEAAKKNKPIRYETWATPGFENEKNQKALYKCLKRFLKNKKGSLLPEPTGRNYFENAKRLKRTELTVANICKVLGNNHDWLIVNTSSEEYEEDTGNRSGITAGITTKDLELRASQWWTTTTRGNFEAPNVNHKFAKSQEKKPRWLVQVHSGTNLILATWEIKKDGKWETKTFEREDGQERSETKFSIPITYNKKMTAALVGRIAPRINRGRYGLGWGCYKGRGCSST